MRSIGHLGMFVLRSALTIHIVLFRWVVVYFGLRAWGVGLDPRRWIALGIAVFPIVRSVVALVAPLPPGPFFRWRHGYRLPSRREQDQIDQALNAVPRSARLPSQVVIQDGPGTSAFTLGTTVVIERGLLGPWLRAALGHEVGCLNATFTRAHLASWWSRYQVLAAIAEALDPPQGSDETRRIGILRRLIGAAVRLFSGTTRFVRWLDEWCYPSILKHDVYAADRWVASHLGTDDLERFLSGHTQPTDFASPYPWLSAVPAVEKRLGKLNAVRLGWLDRA